MSAVTVIVFFFKQKTAYEMRISDWSSDVCSSDLMRQRRLGGVELLGRHLGEILLLQQFLRSEEHTSELQSLMRISYAVFCLKKTHKVYKSYFKLTFGKTHNTLPIIIY